MSRLKIIDEKNINYAGMFRQNPHILGPDAKQNLFI